MLYRDAGLPFPEPVVIQEFDEYQGGAVLEHGLPRLLETNSEVRELHQAFQNSSSSDQRSGEFRENVRDADYQVGRRRDRVYPRWSRGRNSVPESTAGYHNVCPQMVEARQLAVFSSAGLIGVAMRRAFHLSSQDTLRATWMVRNCSYSEFLFSKDRFTSEYV